MTTAAIYNSDLGATWTPAIHGESGIISINDIDPDHPTLHRHRMHLPTTIFMIGMLHCIGNRVICLPKFV